MKGNLASIDPWNITAQQSLGGELVQVGSKRLQKIEYIRLSAWAENLTGPP